MVKILDPAGASKLAMQTFDKHNYMQTNISKTKESRYFSKSSLLPFKIRVSNHRHPVPNSDVLIDLVFDYDTIASDVETQIKNATEAFERKVRLRRLNTKRNVV